jgi:single-strand DNA-binding protein
MNSVNKAIIIGNLGQDPETRVMPSGQTVANLRLATSSKYTDAKGEKIEETEWHNVVCFGKRGDLAAQYLKKGSSVYIEGRIKTRSWDDKTTGEKRYRTEIIADSMTFLSSTQQTEQQKFHDPNNGPKW